MNWLGLLGAVLVLAKLFDIRGAGEWSWFWTLTPFWAPMAIVLTWFGLTLFCGFVLIVIEAVSDKKRIYRRWRR